MLGTPSAPSRPLLSVAAEMFRRGTPVLFPRNTREEDEHTLSKSWHFQRELVKCTPTQLPRQAEELGR